MVVQVLNLTDLRQSLLLETCLVNVAQGALLKFGIF